MGRRRHVSFTRLWFLPLCSSLCKEEKMVMFISSPSDRPKAPRQRIAQRIMFTDNGSPTFWRIF